MLHAMTYLAALGSKFSVILCAWDRALKVFLKGYGIEET